MKPIFKIFIVLFIIIQNIITFQIPLEQFKTINHNKNYFIVDIRSHSQVIKEGFIPNSVNISLKYKFEKFATKLILGKNKVKVIIVSENDSKANINRVKEATTRLKAIGFKLKSHLEGGYQNWKSNNLPIQKMKVLKHIDLPNYLKQNKNHIVLDVREIPEWKKGVLPNSLFISLGNLHLENNLNLLRRYSSKEIIVLCGAGVRAHMAVSLLIKNGFKNVTKIEGGMMRIREKKVKLIKYHA